MSHGEDVTRGQQAPSVPVRLFKLDAKKRGMYFACKDFANCDSTPIPRKEYNPAQPPRCKTHKKPMTEHVEPAT